MRNSEVAKRTYKKIANDRNDADEDYKNQYGKFSSYLNESQLIRGLMTTYERTLKAELLVKAYNEVLRKLDVRIADGENCGNVVHMFTDMIISNTSRGSHSSNKFDDAKMELEHEVKIEVLKNCLRSAMTEKWVSERVAESK